jgi:hypothetical protein
MTTNNVSVLLQFDNRNSVINLNTTNFPLGSANGAFIDISNDTFNTTMTLRPGPAILDSQFPFQFYAAIQRAHHYNQRVAHVGQSFILHSPARVRGYGRRCTGHLAGSRCQRHSHEYSYQNLGRGTHTCAPPAVRTPYQLYNWGCYLRLNRPVYRLLTLIDSRLNVSYSNPVTLF